MIWILLNLNEYIYIYIYIKDFTLEVIFPLKNKHKKYIKHFFHLWLGMHAYRIKHSRVWYYDVRWGPCSHLFCVDGGLMRTCSFWSMIMSTSASSTTTAAATTNLFSFDCLSFVWRHDSPILPLLTSQS